MEKDLYEILGVNEKATPEEIKKAYRRLARRHHPDANQGDARAEERFKEISGAYDVLSDPEKRSQYDQLRSGRAWFGDGAQGGMDFQDGGFGDLEDILGSIFGGGFGKGRRRRQTPSAEIRVPFETAAAGGQVSTTIDLQAPCAACGGAGGTGEKACPSCNGSGRKTEKRGSFSTMHPCPRCGGSGRILTRECTSCGGSGRVGRRETVSVSIPPGSEDGNLLRLGMPDGSSVLLSLRIDPDRFLSRDGADIRCTVRLTAPRAVLGTSVMVRTLEGRVKLRIPAGTQPGTVLRLPGRGVHVGGRRGDQLVRVEVVLPDSVDDEERKAWEQLRRIEGIRGRKG